MTRYVLQLDRMAVLLCGLAIGVYLLMALSEVANPGSSGMTQSLTPYYAILVGVGWGAPVLVRELESGMAVWSWGQGISRGRWFVRRVGPGLVLSAVGAVAVTLLAWLSTAEWNPGMRADEMTAPTLASQGLAPLSFAIFAFCLGLASGALTRRLVPAIGITLIGEVAAAYVVPELAQNLAPTTRVLVTGMTVAGRPVSGTPHPGQLLTIAPDSEFWSCEALIAAVLLGLAAVLFLLSWRVLRQLG
jgi:hypothetical protein